MRRGQKGQSVVEFAVIIPLFLMFVMGIIYGGFAYADYLRCNNAVREIARAYSIEEANKRGTFKDKVNSNNGAFLEEHNAVPVTKLYKVTYNLDDTTKSDYVTVSVTFELNIGDNDFGRKVLPEELKPMQCTMPLE